ncbi:hypothetical protein NDU88_003934 [Pleurodeles waltl]|uniref:Uncharacterized protein n=1 Tax=Pleurodeles waltl TaxID=8319 RepID=A0AAV7NM52_PLEWA|nr:hypothetical protein NDU88_003934 [Pleurodeles waltl]
MDAHKGTWEQVQYCSSRRCETLHSPVHDQDPDPEITSCRPGNSCLKMLRMARTQNQMGKQSFSSSPPGQRGGAAESSHILKTQRLFPQGPGHGEQGFLFIGPRRSYDTRAPRCFVLRKPKRRPPLCTTYYMGVGAGVWQRMAIAATRVNGPETQVRSQRGPAESGESWSLGGVLVVSSCSWNILSKWLVKKAE